MKREREREREKERERERSVKIVETQNQRHLVTVNYSFLGGIRPRHSHIVGISFVNFYVLGRKGMIIWFRLSE